MAAVREHIRDNDLTVGDTLPSEGHFATGLHVSRAVMREAFGALAALRQIDVANGRRARVAALDGSVIASSLDHAIATAQVSAADVWEVRRTLELRTAALAARNRSDTQAQEIMIAAQAMKTAAGDLAALQEADAVFHDAIAQASGNRLFHEIVRSFNRPTDVAVPRAWRARRTKGEHMQRLKLSLEIAQAIAGRDADRASAAMDRYFVAAEGNRPG